MAGRLAGRVFFYLPTFCVAEVFNIFAKYHYRKQLLSPELYQETCDKFSEHIHDRHTFYCYDLNRYHNLNLSRRRVYRTEHETLTEYEAVGANPRTTSEDKVREMYRAKFPKRSIGSHYLSGADLLVIAMNLELIRIVGERVYLVTKDRRMVEIARGITAEEAGTGRACPLKIIDLNDVQKSLGQARAICGVRER